MDIRKPVLGIVVGGTPAPGVNGVIAATVFEATNQDMSVLGFFSGFQNMKTGISSILPLEAKDVTLIHNIGGSILKASKKQVRTEEEVDLCLRVLVHHRVRYLVTIGGVNTALSASLIATEAKKRNISLSIVHVPKTIFNDLPLPLECHTFGFSTAREVGSTMVKNFRTDARTMSRWFVLVVAGAKAGHLALGIGKAAAATLTLIPEEFKNGPPLKFKGLVDILVSSILKRRAMSKDYGVAVVSEGLVDLMDEAEIVSMFGNKKNGRAKLGSFLEAAMQKCFEELHLEIEASAVNIGDVLRSADPNTEDVILTRDLGFGAVRFLLEGGTKCMITLKGGMINAIKLDDIIDPKTGLCQVRLVDLTKTTYQVAQHYMIKLRQADLSNRSFLTKLAAASNMSEVQFSQQFKYIAEGKWAPVHRLIRSPSFQ